jgi:bifunctional DNA-binding transcriptional regulator/antitoxin component of YhaV-PrlF toxin-antitoxin module
MNLFKEFTLRVRKKGIIILPKALRMAVGIMRKVVLLLKSEKKAYS